MTLLIIKFNAEVSHVSSTRPERAEAYNPGQRPGYNGNQQGAL